MTLHVIKQGERMRLYPFVLFIALGLTGCSHFHTNMLAESIKAFSSKVPTGANDKIWVASIADNNACDSGCQSPTSCGGSKGGSKLGGLSFGFGGGGPSSSDRLAYEIISNFFTQSKKARVVESHRHNYYSDGKVETHKKLDFAIDGKNVITGMSCEDLCMLDEAKKRNADKVLVYHLIHMESNKLTIHYRLSDVKSGVIEGSHTISVIHPASTDTSFTEPPQ
jgi:hypothetical protein